MTEHWRKHYNEPTIIREIEQGSDAWFDLRLGRPTASRFRDVLTKPRGAAKFSKTRRDYLYSLAGERLSGHPMDTHFNHHMARGHEREPEARALFEFHTDLDVEEVTMVCNGRVSCSPDGLIGEKSGLEIKDAKGSIQIDRLLTHAVPSEHIPQIQGCIYVTERDSWWFISHCRGIRPVIVQVWRDDTYCKKLETELKSFTDELDELTEKLSDDQNT